MSFYESEMLTFVEMKISIVVPAFNEEGNIAPLISSIREVMNPYQEWEFILIDDGSNDATLKMIKNHHQEDERIHYISFSRNFGHQNALRCGLFYATGDCIISLDADMQHPPHLIPEMIEKWQEGFDIVYTQRQEGKTGFSKKITSSLFYRLMNWLSDVKIEKGTADFRLIDRTVADVLKSVKEPDLFIRGFIAWMGFKQYKISYNPENRLSGHTKYSFRKMFSFALHGITSFSIRPLRFSIIMGTVCSVLAFSYILYAMYINLFTDQAVPGWASTVVTGLFMGGIQLLFMGVIGEYLGKLFIQSKQRPNYIIRESSLSEKDLQNRK